MTRSLLRTGGPGSLPEKWPHAAGLAVAALVAAVALVAAGCGAEAVDEDGEPPARTDVERGELPTELDDPTTVPDPELLLPPLEDFAADDHVDAGEVESSLDHASVPYVEVRRRLILDEQAFVSGEVTVVTAEPGSDGAEGFLSHRYGEPGRTPVEVGGVEMLRVAAEPHPALVWTGPNFAVAFERGAEQTDDWLEELARATVAAIAEQ